MSSSSVLTQIDGPVAHVWLNRPDKLNSFDVSVINGLIDAAETIRRDRDVRVVILGGKGKSFSAGLDFASVMKRRRDVVRNFIPSPLRGTNRFQEVNWVWRKLPVPVIAVTQGHVLGAGLQLALAADFRYSTPDCKWSILEAKWGLVPDMAGTIPLAELVGGDMAKRLTMTGEIISGERAHEIGLVTEIAADPETAAKELIDLLLARSPDSVAASKVLLNKTRHSGVRRALTLERRLQFEVMRSANAKIARVANMKKEIPRFKPRAIR